MPPLDEAQLALLRRKVGNGPTVEELQAIYDRVLSLTETAREVLETRLADMQSDPASFNVQGVYSQDVSTNIKALQNALAWLGDLDTPTTDDDGATPTLNVWEPADPVFHR